VVPLGDFRRKGILFGPQESEVEMHVRENCILVILFFCLLWNVPAAFAEIGKVLEVRPGATLSAGGRKQKLRVGMPVDSGEVIKTNGTGIVQLIFTDQTKIAIGPNASMVLDVSMMRGGKRAKNFTVKALGGSFRFISGSSKKSAYKITTPTATMGIRGTTFDFWVLDKRQTSLALLKGSIRMCGSGGCRIVRGGCEIVATSPQGNVAAPRDNKEAERTLVDGFPFILSQSELHQSLRANVSSCGPSMTTSSLGAITISPTKAPGPIPPTHPGPRSKDFSVVSGILGHSHGKSNSVSPGHHGTGGGHGQGAENHGGAGASSGNAGGHGNGGGTGH
tara:strand:+ start:1217 stop:2221 length:1005 start_codon:yes stop_codon:yes gene_type:complete